MNRKNGADTGWFLDLLVEAVIKTFVIVLYYCSHFRLKRKAYATAQERNLDQIIGMVTFPVVNVLVAILTYFWSQYGFSKEYSMLLPWVVNGLILISTLIFRPHIGVGYIKSFFATIAMGIILGCWFIVACFASAISFQSTGGASLVFFIFLFLGGIFFLGKGVYKILKRGF
jgi:hypothetical protein